MTGSIIVTFDELINAPGGSFIDINVFKVFPGPATLRDRHFTDITNLYSTTLNENDRFNFTLSFGFGTSVQKTYSFNLVKREYTTDDTDGNMGIYDTFITGFTATTVASNVTIPAGNPFSISLRPDTYDFEYRVNLKIISQTVPTPTPTPTLTPTPTPTPVDCFLVGDGANGDIYALLQDSSNRYLVGGQFFSYDGYSKDKIVRLNESGTVDTSFLGNGFDNDGNLFRQVLSIIQDTNGKYVVGGEFTSYSGIVSNNIIRLNSNGSVDTSFASINSGFSYNNVTTNATVWSIIEDSNGKYVVSGFFNKYNGTTCQNLVRLNSDGTFDNSFSGVTVGPDTVQVVIQDSNGKYVLGGGFNTCNGVAAYKIVRLNSDGTKDNTFISTGFNLFGSPEGSVYTIIEDSGKYVVGGLFNTYSGISANCIIKLNSDGTKDTSFNYGNGFQWIAQNPDDDGEVFSIIKDSNGKYVVAGLYDTYSGSTTPPSLIRLNSDGTKDTSFNIGTGFTDLVGNARRVNVIIEDSNQEYLTAGVFTAFNGVENRRITRLKQDGTSDNCIR